MAPVNATEVTQVLWWTRLWALANKLPAAPVLSAGSAYEVVYEMKSCVN